MSHKLKQIMWTLSLVAIAAVLLSAGTGCYGRAIKEGYYGITGATGDAIIIQGARTEILNYANHYGNVKVEPFDSTMGSNIPHSFFTEVTRRTPKHLETREDELDGNPAKPFWQGPPDRTLIVRGTLIHYETADTLDVALGPTEEAICRVTIVDGSTGSQLAVANCIGRCKSTVRSGADELADGVGKAIRKLLKPKDGK